jgi:hypothetical protein
MTANENTQRALEADCRQLVMLYARAMDRNEPDLLNDILTEDVLLSGPGFSISGIENVRAVPASLKERYAATRHMVHNQTVTLDGNTAKGETYSTASHAIKSMNDGPEILVWEVRYQDQFRVHDGRWRISQRELIIDWIETRAITFAAPLRSL